MRPAPRYVVFGVMALVLAGCGGGGGPAEVVTQAPPGASPAAPVGTTVNVTERNYEIEIDPATVSGAFTVQITNEGPGPHAFAISDAAGTVVATSNEIARAKTGQLIVPALAPGEYTYFCPIVGHKREGMVGTLTVQ